jgi:hypothetical protein
MHRGAGVTLIAVAAATALPTALFLRVRLPAPALTAMLTACGLAVGVGALLVQDHVSRTNVAVTLVLASILVPAHVRVVLGPFGPPREAPAGS